MSKVCTDNPDPDRDDDDLNWVANPDHPMFSNSLRFIMLQGLPASGKSTYARRLTQEGYHLISLDTIWGELPKVVDDETRMEMIFHDIVPIRIVGAWASRHEVVYDATNYSRIRRRAIIRQAKRCGYKVYVHVLRVSLEECLKRNAARERKVPEHVIQRMHDNWEDPSLDEGIDGIVEVKV